jgi:hypothetical protein
MTEKKEQNLKPWLKEELTEFRILVNFYDMRNVNFLFFTKETSETKVIEYNPMFHS